jgi:hypothetical protein
MAERSSSCTQPTRGPILPAAPADSSEPLQPSKEVFQMLARVGKPAPDFEAMAYIDGGFELVTLSDHIDHWVLLCFYPGDFTFV